MMPAEHTFQAESEQKAKLLVDATILAESLGIKIEQIHKYTLLFIESAKEGLVEIESALKEKNLQAVALTGHRLKSSSLTVGAQQFSELCKILESLKNGEEIDRAKSIVAQMQSMLNLIEADIEKHFLQNSGNKFT